MSETAELTCQELVELVTAYLESALPAGDRARFDAHLDACGKCRMYVEQMRETIRLTGQIREDHLDAASRSRLLEAFRGWKRGA